MSKLEDREVFEIYAVKYAHNANRTRNGNMLYMDEHDVPMPLDYFVWVIKNDKRTYIVDTGFGEVASKKKGYTSFKNACGRPSPNGGKFCGSRERHN